MKSIIGVLCVLGFALFLVGCAEPPDEPDNMLQKEGTLAAVGFPSEDMGFDFGLFAALVGQEGVKENIFISPASIALALAMTYNGAAGETQQIMARVLGYTGLTLAKVNQVNASLLSDLAILDPQVQIDMANSLWAREGMAFKPDFMGRCEDCYQALVTTLDFTDPGSPAVINGWVSQATQGKIGKVIESIDPNTILYLINVLYFKGTWTVEFDPARTRESDFTLIDGRTKKVSMMESRADYGHYWCEEFEAVSLPYGSGRVSMYIFLPHRTASLKEFYKNLNKKNWEFWMSQFRKEEMLIYLPRLSLDYGIVLNDALCALGMGVAFTPQADFTGMCEDSPWIDNVLHKTFVEVNEAGTEAAAATVVEMTLGGAVVFIVDRPFFCAIRDNQTGALLFIGSIADPS